jgi:hypothetical protein
VKFRTHCEQVFHRAAADIEQEDIAIAELDVKGGRFLPPRNWRRHAGAERDDEHFVRGELFGARIPGLGLFRGRLLGRGFLHE